MFLQNLKALFPCLLLSSVTDEKSAEYSFVGDLFLFSWEDFLQFSLYTSWLETSKDLIGFHLGYGILLLALSV